MLHWLHPLGGLREEELHHTKKELTTTRSYRSPDVGVGVSPNCASVNFHLAQHLLN